MTCRTSPVAAAQTQRRWGRIHDGHGGMDKVLSTREREREREKERGREAGRERGTEKEKEFGEVYPKRREHQRSPPPRQIEPRLDMLDQQRRRRACFREKIIIELMRLDRKLKASREGSEYRNCGT